MFIVTFYIKFAICYNFIIAFTNSYITLLYNQITLTDKSAGRLIYEADRFEHREKLIIVGSAHI